MSRRSSSQLRLRLLDSEVLITARLLEHLPARRDTTNSAARCHGFDVWIEELLRRLEVKCRDSLYELAGGAERHRYSLIPEQWP